MTEFPFVPLTAGTASMQSHDKGTAPAVCLHTEPYLEVAGSPNPEAVLIIKELRTGADGELTAIAQYVFQNNRITNNDAVSAALLQIAIVEMMHLDVLGDAIQALGGKPSFDDGKYYWQAGHVNYADDLVDMLNANIEGEEAAIAAYEAGDSRTDNDSL